MKKNSLYLIIGAALLLSPFLVSANHNNLHTLEELRAQLASIQAAINALLASSHAPGRPDDVGRPADTGRPEDTGRPADTGGGGGGGGGGGSGPAPQAAPQATEDRVSATPAPSPAGGPAPSHKLPADQARVPVPPTPPSPVDSAGSPPADSEPVPVAPPGVKLGRALVRGSSGEDVSKLQDFLKRFPDIYPQGLVTGFFGPLSEQAVKKLQDKFGIEPAGIVGPQTRGKLGALAAAVGRKERPRISAVAPASVSVGSVVTVTGSGFVFDDNAVFVKGRIIIKGLTSPAGDSLTFSIPPNIPCAVDEACPIKVINWNGISNAKPFKLAQLPLPPEPEPDPLPPPPPLPPPTPVITAVSPSYGQIGGEVTITGSGFAVANNSISFGGTANAVTGLGSPDGVTLKFKVPNIAGCQPVSVCSISVTNSGGTSNAVNFTVAQVVTPVAVARPNGGEQFLQGATSTVSWTGGTDAVHVALVEATADNSGDPAGLIVGWLSTAALPNGSLHWNAKEVCDASGAVCFPVSPGSYKILAVSENELGLIAIGVDGRGNWDVSDRAFSVLPAPLVSVVSPNGGEKLIYGSSATVSWEATSILSRTVKINLWRNGVFYRTVAANVPQSASDGLFVYSWTPTSDIPAGNSYTIEVADAVNTQTRDFSDSAFAIGPKSSLTLTLPNGGESWFKGLQAAVRWNSGNILSKAVHIDLFKGGVFSRRLASNVPQKFYSWETQSYVSGTGFNYALSVPTDLPDGTDYALVISDSSDASTSDASDAVFSILTVPNPMTVSGRLINRFTASALSNTRLYSHAYYGPYVPQWSGSPGNTDSEGRFSVSTTTSDGFVRKIPVGAWPSCYMNWSEFIDKLPDRISFWHHVFDLQKDISETLLKSDNNLGDVPMWPGTGLYAYTDRPDSNYQGASPGVWYPDSGYWGWQILALEADLQVRIYDPTTNTYVLSPSIKIPLVNGCVPKTLTYLGGVLKWEPYNVRSGGYSGGSLSGATVGTPLKVTFFASGGVAPYVWSRYYGSLPPGLTLDPATGVLSGTPTALGTYKFQIKITDANGVNGGTWPLAVTVQ